MKRLAYVAYFFPPTGGAGVQRTLKFVRYLPDHGWIPSVVTVRAAHYWMRDESLARELQPGVQVERTPAITGPALLDWIGLGRRQAGEGGRRSGRSQGRLRRLAGWIAIPDPFVGWVPFAVRAASRILAQGGICMTTSSPDSAHLVGLRLASRGIPWVADFRDPWVRRLSFAPPSALHRRIQESLEGRVVRAATRLIVTSEATRQDFLARYPRLDPNRIVVITNGYDEEDFPRSDPPPDPAFLIVHAGQLNPERGIGPLLDCLEAFLAARPDARDQTRVELIGPRYLEDEREVQRRGLSGIVRFAGSLPHRASVERLGAARVLVLMEQESARGSLILPGKTFEYLRARRPILGLVPRGAAWDLITGLHAGRCSLPSEPRAGAGHLAGFFDGFLAGQPVQPPVDGRKLGEFARPALAARLAALLDEVEAAAPPLTGRR